MNISTSSDSTYLIHANINIAKPANANTLFVSMLPLYIFALSFISCDKEIEIQPKEGPALMVVEGHIETNSPPYVILTQSLPYFSDVSVESFTNSFVHGADITVSDGTNTTKLIEVSSDTLPPYLRQIISDQSGFTISDSDSVGSIIIYAYLTADINLFGRPGKSYQLTIKKDGKLLTAQTTIPPVPTLDSVWSVPHPTNDTLATLNIRYSDPGGVKNFIRYFTSINTQPFYPPYFQSVLDDRSVFNVDGKTFEFPIEKGHNRNLAVDFNTFTYFTKGDSVTLRWCAIDEAHYNFWSTAEFDRGNVGNPFASPTKIKSNIQGGLGIWGGYSQIYYPVVIPKN